jgi:hypothetical protein
MAQGHASVTAVLHLGQGQNVNGWCTSRPPAPHYTCIGQLPSVNTNKN